jgi:hypothetical protein
MAGCLGIGDAFAERRQIGGGYFLSKFEDGGIYLWKEDESGSVAGPIDKIAWNRDFIIINSSTATSKWMVIDINDRKTLVGREEEEVEKRLLSTLHLMDTQEAWAKAQ